MESIGFTSLLELLDALPDVFETEVRSDSTVMLVEKRHRLPTACPVLANPEPNPKRPTEIQISPLPKGTLQFSPLSEGTPRYLYRLLQEHPEGLEFGKALQLIQVKTVFGVISVHAHGLGCLESLRSGCDIQGAASSDHRPARVVSFFVQRRRFGVIFVVDFWASALNFNKFFRRDADYPEKNGSEPRCELFIERFAV